MLTFHVHLDLVVVKESDVDPLVLAGADLLVVDDVVAGGAVAALVELELVPAQSCKSRVKYSTQAREMSRLLGENSSLTSSI